MTQQKIQYSSHHFFRMGKLTGSSLHMALSWSHATPVEYSLKLHPWIRLPYSHLMLTLWVLQVVIYTVYEALNSLTVAQTLSMFEYSILVSCSDSSPRCRVALTGAARNQAQKLSYYWVFHLVGQKESVKIRNTTDSSLAPKWRGKK